MSDDAVQLWDEGIPSKCGACERMPDVTVHTYVGRCLLNPSGNDASSFDTRQEFEDAYREAHSPLTTQGVLWVAALDRIPIEERVEWVAKMTERVEQINTARARGEWSDV